MVESIVAAAASRIGKKVLHVDKYGKIIRSFDWSQSFIIFFCRNDFYGGVWASFNIEGIEKYVTKQDASKVDLDSFKKYIHEGEQFLELGNNICGISDVVLNWHIPKYVIYYFDIINYLNIYEF